jgi:hypothetical protein
MDNALKPLWAFGFLLVAKVWCDVGFLYLVFFFLDGGCSICGG